MEIQINKTTKDNYNVSQNTDFDGTINIELSPKKRKCKVCRKLFEAKKRNALGWTDDKGFYRIGHFCKEHYILAKKVLTEVKRIALS